MPNKLYIISGAGLSAESGLSTFRSSDGLWSKFQLDKVCNFLTWKDNREAVFEFYNARKDDVRNAQPNAAHRTLARWQERYGAERVVLFTQNVDDLLERAGAKDVIHLHGDLDSMTCYGCGHRWNIGKATFDVDGTCPRCPCKRAVKPGVVFFHEQAPLYAALRKMRDELAPEDVVLVVGSAMQVLPACQLLPARRRDLSRNLQVNPTPADSEYFGHNIALPASTGLAQLEPLLDKLMAPTPPEAPATSFRGFVSRVLGR